MKRLTTYIQERLIINKDYHIPYTCAPKSFDELKNIIKQRYKEQGPGTEKDPIDFNDINVSHINSFCNEYREGIFEKTKFEYIDISEWHVSNVENMSYMFNDCNDLKSVGDLSNWNITNVKYMSYMFRGCAKLKSVGDLSKWDISNVEYMTCAFLISGIKNTPDWYKG